MVANNGIYSSTFIEKQKIVNNSSSDRIHFIHSNELIVTSDVSKPILSNVSSIDQKTVKNNESSNSSLLKSSISMDEMKSGTSLKNLPIIDTLKELNDPFKSSHKISSNTHLYNENNTTLVSDMNELSTLNNSHKKSISMDILNPYPKTIRVPNRFKEYASNTFSRMRLPSPNHLNDNEMTNEGKKIPRLVGLQNLGNTWLIIDNKLIAILYLYLILTIIILISFMNCCLQCLQNIPPLSLYFIKECVGKDKDKDKDDLILLNNKKNESLSFVYGEFINLMYHGIPFSSFRPIEIKRIIGKYATRFINYEQQDAQEFLRFLLDGLHEDMNLIKEKPAYYEIKDDINKNDIEISNEYWKYYHDRNKSILSDLFTGQLCSYVTCQYCNQRSVCFDIFWDLSLPIPNIKKNINRSRINLFSKDIKETKDTNDTNKNSKIINHMTIQDCLKMYTEEEYIKDSYYCSKCKEHRSVIKKILIYRCPKVLVIHLKRFSFSTTSRAKVTIPIQYPIDNLKLNEFCSKDMIQEESKIYDLTGIVHHIGNLNGGHYTAECLNNDTGEWYDFNDSHVTKIGKPHMNSSSSYILFYIKR